MDRILCLGDGFAYGHLWPEWPQILQAIFPDHEVVLISAIGAGNEFLVNGLIGACPDHDVVIFQWSPPGRFDKMLTDHSWDDLVQADAIYKNNVYESNGHRWWCSSASPQPDVRRYHEYFVQSAQAEQRFHDQRVLIDHYLAHNQCWYIETSYSEQEAFSRQNRFDLIRGNEVQPKPMVHFHFVKERVLSKLPWPIDQSRVDRLEAALQNHDWPAHDPNKDHVWQKITSDLDIV